MDTVSVMLEFVYEMYHNDARHLIQSNRFEGISKISCYYGPGRRPLAYLLYYMRTVSAACAKIFITTLHRAPCCSRPAVHSWPLYACCAACEALASCYSCCMHSCGLW